MHTISLSYLVLCLVVTLFGIASCNRDDGPSGLQDDNNADTASSNGILPLSKGNQWISLQQTFDSTGALTTSFHDTSSVVGNVIINGERWYYFVPDPRAFYVNRSDGMYYYVTEWAPEPFLNLKYPGKAGDAYTIPYALGTIDIISIDTIITCPAGSYSCYRYRVPFPNDWVYDYYYSVGVGLVLSMGERRPQGSAVTMRTKRMLVSFNVRP